MARRIDINRIIQSQFVSDLPLIIVGCAIAGFATDAFMVPNGLAAGGLTGLATIIAELGRRAGPVSYTHLDVYKRQPRAWARSSSSSSASRSSPRR